MKHLINLGVGQAPCLRPDVPEEFAGVRGRPGSLILALLALLFAACEKQEPKPVAAAAAPAPGEERLADGTVVIPADSPKLKEIHVAEVKTASVPFDEVTVAGQDRDQPEPGLARRPAARRARLLRPGEAGRFGEARRSAAHAGIARCRCRRCRLFAGAGGDHAGQGQSQQGAGRLRPLHRSLRAQRRGEERRAHRRERAGAGQGGAGTGAGGAGAVRPQTAAAGTQARHLRPEGHGDRAHLRQDPGDERGARRVPQRYQCAGDDDRRPEHGVGRPPTCPKARSASSNPASASMWNSPRTPARPSTGA